MSGSVQAVAMLQICCLLSLLLASQLICSTGRDDQVFKQNWSNYYHSSDSAKRFGNSTMANFTWSPDKNQSYLVYRFEESDSLVPKRFEDVFADEGELYEDEGDDGYLDEADEDEVTSNKRNFASEEDLEEENDDDEDPDDESYEDDETDGHQEVIYL